AGKRSARPEGHREGPSRQQHLLARVDVGGDHHEYALEVAEVATFQQPVEVRLELAAAEQCGAVQTEVGDVREDVAAAHGAGLRAELVDALAGRVERADDRAKAGAHQQVGGETVAFEAGQGPDVGVTPGAAATQGDADTYCRCVHAGHANAAGPP